MTTTEIRAAHNRRLAKVAVQCSAESFMVNQTLVFQIKFCGEKPAKQKADKRYSEQHRITEN
jgi:hypothetical protein